MKKVFSNMMDGFKLGHRLFDKGGNLVASSTPLTIRGKVRVTGADGSVVNTHNCTVYNGRRFILESLLRQEPVDTQMLTLNKILNINKDVTVTAAQKLERAICLVGVGTGGAGTTFGSKIDSTMNDNNLFNIIPLRTVRSPLTGDDAEKYFMRKYENVGGEPFYNYYLMKVSTDGIVTKHENTAYKPSIEDNDAVHDTNNPLSLYNIQVMTTIPIEISENAIKDYFRATDGNINMARFNELALYFGIPVTITAGDNSYTDYVLVEAFSHLTFNNRAMDTEGSRYDFTYYLIA